MFEPGLIAKTAQDFDAEKFGGILEEIVGSLPAFSSELLLIAFVLAIFLLDLMLPLRVSKHLAWVAALGCFLPAMSGGHVESDHSLFQGMLVSDSFAGFFKPRTRTQKSRHDPAPIGQVRAAPLPRASRLPVPGGFLPALRHPIMPHRPLRGRSVAASPE
mgnify:CR=1 FL=1